MREVDVLRAWIEFLANIVGVCGLFFFFYEYKKDKKEINAKIIEDEKKKEKKDAEEKIAFELAKKYIFQISLLKLDVSEDEDIVNKIQTLRCEENYTLSDIKLLGIKHSLLDVKIRAESDIENGFIKHIIAIDESLQGYEEYHSIMEYIDRINTIEKMMVEFCDSLSEEAMKYSNLFSNDKITELLTKINDVRFIMGLQIFEGNVLEFRSEDGKFQSLLREIEEFQKMYKEAVKED